jgi:hypothetical protein
VLLSDAGASPVPVIAHLHEHRHEHVPEKVEGAQDGRQAGDLLVDARCVVLVQRSAERGGVQRSSHRIDRGHGARIRGLSDVAQGLVAEGCEAADAVPVFHCVA